jgi:hypothetical protein
MTNNHITKYQLDSAGAIFASAFISKTYKLNNYKYIDYVIAYSEGEAAQIKAQVFSKSDESEKALGFRRIDENGLPSEYIEKDGEEITIGGLGGVTVYRITADDLAKDGYDSVILKLTFAEGSTVTGAVAVACYEPRYSE